MGKLSPGDHCGRGMCHHRNICGGGGRTGGKRDLVTGGAAAVSSLTVLINKGRSSHARPCRVWARAGRAAPPVCHGLMVPDLAVCMSLVNYCGIWNEKLSSKEM